MLPLNERRILWLLRYYKHYAPNGANSISLAELLIR